MLSIGNWWLITAPTDLRCGMDRLLLQRGRAAVEGEAYVFAYLHQIALTLRAVARSRLVTDFHTLNSSLATPSCATKACKRTRIA